MPRSYIVAPGVYLNETGTRSYIVAPGVYVNETESFVSSWQQPLSIPVRSRKVAAALLVAACCWTPFTPSGAETVTVDKWYQPLSTPVRDAAFEVISNTTNFVVPPDNGNLDKWYRPLSEPTRRKPPPAQQALAWSGFTPAAEVVTIDKWYAAWREPVQDKAFEVVSDIAAFAAIPTPAATITEDEWHQAWSVPVRLKPGLRGYLQQPLTFVAKPVVSFSWFNSLNEPPKTKKLSASQQQAVAWVPFREVVTEDKWHQPWSEPVRRKPPLRIAPETAMVPFATPYAVVSFGWNVPQNDLAPRRKPGLEARYQQAAAFYPYPIVPITLAVMAATETPDVMDTDGIAYSPPSGALVGVIELSTDSVPTAIVSIRQR
jgi:hypothetical protein